jgi:uncharacterized RDD family membrane protein YckC
MSSPPRHAIVSAWPRCQAQIVDMIIVFLATSAVTMTRYSKADFAVTHPSVWITFAVIGLLYFTLFEWRSGQTPGKKLVDIEVRTVDGAAFMRRTPLRQRLGDRVAGTIVVRSRPDAPALRNDGTHALEQPEADAFVTEVESEIGRPPWHH